MSTQMSHSANRSPAPGPAAATSGNSPEAPLPSGRPAGILPMPATLLAAAEGASGSDVTGRGAVPTTGGGDNAAEGPMQHDITNMANTKEKTPMCLLNELARFNKLQPKYELTSEKGPPHQKLFTVCLTLGSQSYESAGPSIKKAQHGAAAMALEKCGLPHPVPRNNPPKFKKRNNMMPNTDAMTPTVKLNSLAMKIGKQVEYHPLNPIPPRPFYGGGYRGPRGPQGGMSHPHPGGQQGMGGPQGQHQAPPQFHPPGPPQMPPPPLQHPQGPPPPGLQAPPQPPQQQPIPQQPQQQQQQSPPQPPQGQTLNPNQPDEDMDPQQQQQQHQQHMQQGGGHPYNQHQRPYYPRYPRPYIHFVKVMVGDREFVGEGKTPKGARQNAAARALDSIEDPENGPAQKVDQATTTNVPVADSNKEVVNGNRNEKNVKSDISLVYEAANLHNLNVVFKVLEEKGQPHLKVFKLQCIVGDFVVEADGPSKKDAKRKAAELMLPKLKGLPPVPAKVMPPHHMQRQLWRDKNSTNKKKKSKSLVKMSPEDPNFGAPGLHPISRLVQILQAKNEREPEFTVVEERPLMERAGPHMVRRREFTIQVSADSKTVTGKGKTKKDAKKLAAENMLKVLGYSPTPEVINGLPGSAAQPSKSALKTGSAGKVVEEADRKVTFKEDKQKSGPKDSNKEQGSPSAGNSGKGLAPGLLPMMPGVGLPPQPQMFPSGPAPPSGHKLPGQGLNRAPGAPVTSPNAKTSPKSKNVIDVARDLLSLGHSPTAEALLKGTSGPHSIPNLSRPSQQLEYLAKVNKLTIKFNDFDKGPKGEYKSVVYLTTEPQSAFRGAALSIEAAHDAASITALRVLAGISDGDGGKKVGGM